jgi:ubiquinone/menaquinone biosynthesis C-methylase UbiE
MGAHAYEFDEIAQNVFFPIYEAIARDALASTGKKGGLALDIGCGGGHLGLSLAKLAPFTVILLDKDADAVGIAHRRAVEWGLSERAIAIEGDAMDLPLPDASVDFAVSRGSVGFWEDGEKAFSEILRVLAPGGKTWIGGGLGGPELKPRVTAKMKERDPDWPECLKKITNGYGAAEYRGLLEGLSAKGGGGFTFSVIDDADRGMWIAIEKGGAA